MEEDILPSDLEKVKAKIQPRIIRYQNRFDSGMPYLIPNNIKMMFIDGTKYGKRIYTEFWYYQYMKGLRVKIYDEKANILYIQHFMEKIK